MSGVDENSPFYHTGLMIKYIAHQAEHREITLKHPSFDFLAHSVVAILLEHSVRHENSDSTAKNSINLITLPQPILLVISSEISPQTTLKCYLLIKLL